jgi:hypothetical protein
MSDNVNVLEPKVCVTLKVLSASQPATPPFLTLSTSDKTLISLSSFQQEEADVHFDPVIHLTEQVVTKTMEEDEDVIFKMYGAAFARRLSWSYMSHVKC